MGLLDRLLDLTGAPDSGEPDYYAPLRRRDYAGAVPLLHEAIRREDGHAMAIYATLLAFGRGVERSMEDAVDWFRQAAVRGEVAAQAAFGACLASGYGVAINQKEAAYWLYRAACAGHDQAPDMLGDLVMCNRMLVGEHFSQDEFEEMLRLAHRPNGVTLH